MKTGRFELAGIMNLSFLTCCDAWFAKPFLDARWFKRNIWKKISWTSSYRGLHHAPFDDLSLSSQAEPSSLAMFLFLRLLVLVLWPAVSRGSTQCPQKCTCAPFGKFTRVKCLGIDEVPTGIPSNTILLYVSRESSIVLPRDILAILPLSCCFSL